MLCGSARRYLRQRVGSAAKKVGFQIASLRESYCWKLPSIILKYVVSGFNAEFYNLKRLPF